LAINIENQIETKIIGQISSNPRGIYISRIAKNTGLSRSSVSKYALKLEAEKKIEIIQYGRAKVIFLTAQLRML
jgi:uncharacterized membrane protein